jgi:hypothetical protein
MKLQLQSASVRLRIDEDELAVLLADGQIEDHTAFGTAFTLRFTVSLTNDAQAGIDGEPSACRLRLPAQAVRELAARLPTREGLTFDLGVLELLFDVDVRDSVRRRYPGRD